MPSVTNTLSGRTVLKKALMQSTGMVAYADGAIGANRLVKVDGSGNIVEASYEDTAILGLNAGSAAATDDQIIISRGIVTCVADNVLAAGEPIKAANGGRVSRAIDAQLEGTVMATGAGGNFANQPANDAVEVVSDAAGDTAIVLGIWGTTDGTNDVTMEEVTLNGTTPVATVKTDWGKILAIDVTSGTIAGTVTVREASGDAAITTLAAASTGKGSLNVNVSNQAAYNGFVTLYADGATTKTVGLVGIGPDYSFENDESVALDGANEVEFPARVNKVFRLLVGDVESARTVTLAVGMEDDATKVLGYSMAAATANDEAVQCFLK